MFAKVLASLVVVAALGIGGYTMYTNHACTGCPFSSSKAATETDCCATHDDCCATASSCCADDTLAKVSASAGAACSVEDDCCSKAGISKQDSAISAIVGVPATLKAATK